MLLILSLIDDWSSFLLFSVGGEFECFGDVEEQAISMNENNKIESFFIVNQSFERVALKCTSFKSMLQV